MHHQLDVLTDAASQQVLHVRHDNVEIERLELDLVPAPEDQQLPGELGGLLGCLDDLPHVSPDRLVVRRRLGREPGVVEDDGQQVVEVVRNTAGQHAQAFQAPGLMEAVFHPLAFGLSLQLLPGGVVFQRALMRFLKLPRPVGHRLLERGVQLLQARDQTAVLAAEPGTVDAGHHVSHQIFWKHRLAQEIIGQADRGDGVGGGHVPRHQHHAQVGIPGFQARGQSEPGRVGEPLINHGQIRPGAFERRLDGLSRSEAHCGNPGQGQDLGDGFPHARVVIDDVDQRPAGLPVRAGQCAHVATWGRFWTARDASAIRLSIRRVSKGLCTMANALALTAARSRSSCA